MIKILPLIALCLFMPFTTKIVRGQAESKLPAFATGYNDPVLGKNVFIFDPSMNMKEMQELIDTLYSQQHPRSSEFSVKRYALLFKTGIYHLDLKVGYYMSYYGLGKSPDDVVIKGIILSKGEKNGNVTCNFWRSVENLCIDPPGGQLSIWGVSQASPMRRVHVKGDIQLHDNGWASGGFMADCKIDGTIYAGGQQQWFTRNSNIGRWDKGGWNFLFMGVVGAPQQGWPENPYTVISHTPEIKEKPYIVFRNNQYELVAPELQFNSFGSTDPLTDINRRSIPLSEFYIANPATDNALSLNKVLSSGKSILFTPGIYNLDQSLRVTAGGTMLIGMGTATLASVNGNAVIETADVDGITISGLLVDAGKVMSPVLVQIGEKDSDRNLQTAPTYLHDIFIRVGGYGEGRTESCMIVNSGNVTIDHIWLWRADHGKNVGWNDNITKNGLIVNGDKVTVYGLFCEHFHEYQTLWNGNDGKVFFYQSEMPYDPPTPEAFNHGQTNGYASYKVSDHVTSHEAWSLGIYCVFYKAPVIVDQAIETPPALEGNIHHKLTYWLYGGHKESRINSIINGKGAAVHTDNVKSVMK